MAGYFVTAAARFCYFLAHFDRWGLQILVRPLYSAHAGARGSARQDLLRPHRDLELPRGRPRAGPPRMSLRGGRWALLAGVLLHLIFVVSLRTQWLNPLFVETRHAYGQAGDFFGVYQAGDNLVHGWSIYDAGGLSERGGAARAVLLLLPLPALRPPTSPPSPASSSPPDRLRPLGVPDRAPDAAVVVTILRLRRFPIRDRSLYAGLWLGFFPFYLEQWMGQFSFLMAGFLWILFREGMRDRV